jgi:uncharacterized protein YqeY
MDPPEPLPARLKADLTRALKARARLDVGVLRTTLAAIANAEAPPADLAPTETRGRLVQHARLVLSDDDHERILRDEIADREDTISQYTGAGRLPEAAVLRDEIAVLRRYLPAGA